MKNFLLGVASTLGLLTVLAAVAVISLGSPGSAPDLPSPSATTAPLDPPADLAPGETWLAAATLDGRNAVTGDATLTDVRADGIGLRFGPEGLHADRLDLSATLPFGTVARQVGDGVRLYAVSGGMAGIERSATILGRAVTVRATGRVTADNGQLLIEPETVDLGGPSWLNSAASAVARNLVTIRQDVPGVPSGMRLTQVAVSGAGFAVDLTGQDVTMSGTPGS
jgi:hypothetical protein